nr:uncharacterized protein LOC112009631 [Quercus suber]
MTQNRLICQQYKQQYPPRQQQGQTYNSGMSLEDIVKSFATNTLQFQQEARANIQSLDNQMGQMATAISRLEAQSSGKLPSQMVVNPRENASAIILRSGKEVEIPVKVAPALLKCEVNIPLLDAIKQVARYAKFLKELCTIKRKRKLKGCEKVRVGENVSVIIQRKLPAKCKDPSMFTIPCTIGNTQLEKAMLDLGASINVMPYSIYVSLKLGPLNKTGIVIQLADRFIAYPKDVVEDVLVQINDLVFSANFYMLDMENGDQTTPILLGRPFLKTSKTKIDVHSGTLTMEFDGEIVKFNIYDAMKYPDDNNLVYSIDMIDSLAHEAFELDGKYGLEEIVAALNDFLKLQQSGNVPYIALPVSNEKPLPSVLQDPIPDLNLLPHRKLILDDALWVYRTAYKMSTVEIQSLATSKVFKVNGHRLKPFYEGFLIENVVKLDLEDPIYTD